jgi:hypothetical protein
MSVLTSAFAHFSRGTARNVTSSSLPAASISVFSSSYVTNSSSVARIGAEWRTGQIRPLHASTSLHRSPAYPGHIPLNTFENAFLSAGSALMALIDPRRGGKSSHKHLSIFPCLLRFRHGCCPGRDHCRLHIAKIARRYARLSRGPQNPERPPTDQLKNP